MRSLFSGISGLNNHQVKMDVISDNIANVNTHGFKKSRVIFSNIFNQTIGYASAPSDIRGGVNAKQVGLGVQTAAIDRIFTQGATETTGVASDCAIEGEGLFITNDGNRTLYTRAGNFLIDAAGDLVHGGTGNKIMGWAAQWSDDDAKYTVNTGGVLSEINFLNLEKLAAKASTELVFKSNLKATADARNFPEQSTLTYGVAPNEEQVSFKIQKRNENLYELTAFDDQGNPVDMDTSTPQLDSRALIHLYDDGRIKAVEVNGNYDIYSISANPIIGALDNFTINLSPSTPPTVNYWTFRDINNVERKMYVNYEKDPSSTTLVDVYRWKVYDEDGNLLDLNADGVIDENGDFGTMSILNSIGKIAGFTSPTGLPSFTIDGLTIDLSLSADLRQMVLTDNATGESRDIELGSNSLNIRLANSNRQVNFDFIPGTMHSTSLMVYDSQGTPHELITTFEKLDDNRWRYFTSLSMDDPIVLDYLAKFPDAIKGEFATEAEKKEIMKNIFWDADNGYVGEGTLVFNSLGRIDRDATRAENGVSYPDIVKTVSFQPQGADMVRIKLDMEGITQYDSQEFTTAARSQDGYPMGMLQGYSISLDGKIVGSYSNDRMQEIGQVAIATFSNAMGLNREPGSMWSTSGNSGEAVIRIPGTGGAGIINSGKLEMSNVDLSQEFTDMIIAQRGFQANSRSITTADQLLQELVNLKR